LNLFPDFKKEISRAAQDRHLGFTKSPGLSMECNLIPAYFMGITFFSLPLPGF